MLVLTRRPVTATLAGATAMALCLAATVPGAASALTAAEAWTDFQALATRQGLTVTTTSVASAPDAVTVDGVRIFPASDPNALLISMDRLVVTGEGDLIGLIPSSPFDVAVLVAGGQLRHFTVTHDGRLAGRLDDENASLTLDFPHLDVALQPVPAAKGTTDPLAVDVSFGGLAATLNAARAGAGELTLDAATLGYDVTYPDPGTRGATISQQGSMEGLHLGFTGTELDTLDGLDRDGGLRAAFDGGFSAHLEVTGGASEQQATQMMQGQVLRMHSVGTGSEMQLTIADGRFDLTGSASSVSGDGTYGPMAGGFSLGGMRMAFGAPLVVTPDDQPARYMIALEDASVTPEILAMLGAGQFAGDHMTIAVDLGAQARLTREIGPAWSDTETPPVDVSSASLDDLRIQIGDSSFTGSGAVTLIGGLMGQIGQARPNADGHFLFDLVGGERMLTRLQSMGVVPQDQLFFVRMMLNGLGRPVGDDHLQSEVVLTPGGGVTVNGAPLPF